MGQLMHSDNGSRRSARERYNDGGSSSSSASGSSWTSGTRSRFSSQSRRQQRAVKRSVTLTTKVKEDERGKDEAENSAPSATAAESLQLVPYYNSTSPTTPWDHGEDEHTMELPFSTRRPRDLGAGLSSGLKSAAKGLGLGVISLVAAPAYGAVQEGLGGFIKGLGAGVVMAVALPVTGVGIGIAQAARGAINTPEAVIERRAGKKWDKEKREWREHWYSLEEEIEELKKKKVALEEKKRTLAAAGDQATSSTGQDDKPRSAEDTQQPNKKVADTYYYDLLGVQPNASAAEIRKMYYKLARECHPDKHPDDPTANARFQALGDAYQVLADPQRRERYDVHGKGATEDMPVVESKMIFAILFGAEKFDPFVGRLHMVTVIEAMDSAGAGGKLAEEFMELEQKQRETLLASQLRERLTGYVHGNEGQRAQWRSDMIAIAKDLCSNAFGDAIVEAIGWTYENYSTQFLGKLDTFLGLGGRYAKFQAKNREMSNFWRVAGTAVRASLAARRLSKITDRVEKAKKVKEQKEAEAASKADATDLPSEKCPGDAKASKINDDQRAEGAKQLEETLPLLFATMLQICLLDIEATVRKAAKKVLKDMATSIDVRREEAAALIELGQIFQHEAEEFKKEHKDEKVDVLKHMEDAYIRATAEADKEAHKSDDAEHNRDAPERRTEDDLFS